MLLAQAETMAKAATDLVSARDVVPFMGAAIALLLAAVVYLFRLRETERTEHNNHLKTITENLSKKAGDSHA